MPAHQGEKKRTKATFFFSVFGTQTLGQLSFTPTLTRLPSGTPLQPFTRIIQVNNNEPDSAPLTCALHNNRQMATAPRPPPRFVWLRFILGKVASAISAAAHSHLKQPRSCLLDISSPPPQSAECNTGTHTSCNSNPCLTDIFFYLGFFSDVWSVCVWGVCVFCS